MIAKALSAIHICSGSGGITLGFERAGIKTALAFDFDPITIETHQSNFPDRVVKTIDICEISCNEFPDANIWTCGIPCEPYSIAGKRLEDNDDRDISGELIRLIGEARENNLLPNYIFLENVPPFRKSLAAEKIRNILYDYSILEAIFLYADYGVPQKRKRWHLIASQKPPAPCPKPTHSEFPTLFGSNTWLRFGDIREEHPKSPKYLSARALKGIIRRQRSKASKAFSRGAYPYAAAYIVEDDDLLPTVLSSWHKGISRNQSVLVFDNYKFRMPTLLEVARAQGFPDDYIFCGTLEQQYGQIGRAVPPPFSEAIARAFIDHSKAFL